MLFGQWSLLVDKKAPALNFSSVTGLDKFVSHLIPAKDLFTMPASEHATVEATASDPAAATPSYQPASSGKSTWSVGQIISVARRVTVDMPLPDDPGFRKDMRVGARCKILEIGHNGVKLKIKPDIMHQGEAHDVDAWVTANMMKPVVASGADDEDANPNEVPDITPVPDCIKNAHATDTTVSWVDDWPDLVEDSGPSAALQWTKAGAQIAMRYVHERMPKFTDKDLGVLHRVNAHGAKRVEVWTLRAFKNGEIVLSPVTSEVKTRMHTHNASVRVQTPQGSVLENRLLALDGRGKTHLSHGNPEQHEPVATGSLFWAMERTSKAEEANMTLYMANVYIPEIKVTIPGTAQHTAHLKKDGGFPCVPVLKNTKALKMHTRLVALDDPVVAEAADKDRKARYEERALKEKEGSATKRQRTA